MAKLMTADEFGAKKVDHVRAIELAQGEYHSASFKLSTGSGDAGGVKAAKAHLAALRDQLEDLEAAWIAMAAAADREIADSKVAAFEAFRSEVEELLVTRRAAVAAVTKDIVAAVAGIKRYQDATRAIRTKAAQLRTNPGPALSRAADGLNSAAGDETCTAQMAAAAALGEARIRLAPGKLYADLFGSLDPLGFEDRVAEKIRQAVSAFAPKPRDD